MDQSQADRMNVIPNADLENGTVAPVKDIQSMSEEFRLIDALTTQPESESEFSSNQKKITHKHWKPKESFSHCADQSCGKRFSLLRVRRHHCRRCGDVFCARCLKYRRRLNQLAHLDPQGRYYKVCKTCYEEGQSAAGAARDITAEFVSLRELSLQTVSGDEGETSKLNNRVNYDEECQRLIDGFRRNVGNSEFRRAFHEMKNMMSRPNWKKAANWLEGSVSESCQSCCETFGFLRKRHFCKVCGLALCKSCSTKDLLIFVLDSSTSMKTSGIEPSLAIVRIVGCPEVEPEISMYLRVCNECREEMVKRQEGRAQDDEAQSGLDMMAELWGLHRKFSAAEANVNTQLRDYQEIVDSLENNRKSSDFDSSLSLSESAGNAPQSNMCTLAKTQEDLTDFLGQYASVVQRLKTLSPKTDSQSRLLKNYIKAKCDFYMDNMATVRQMKPKLGESSASA